MKRALTWLIAAGACGAIALTVGPLGATAPDAPAPAWPELAELATPEPCVRTDFKTELVKKACAAGGQKAAKKAMKAFTKDAKAATGEKITCKTCHDKLGPDYPLKSDAYDLFATHKKAIADKAAAPTP